MTASIHSSEYRCVLRKLREIREASGMTQRDLAKLLKRENSFVWRIETGKRRLDVVEFYWVCKALRQDATVIYRQLIQEINSLGSRDLSKQERTKPRVSLKSPRKPK